MDQMTDLQMPAPADFAAHLAHAAANSTTTTTSHVPNHNLNQPSYDEMIIAAISALKDKDGSSRQAIAKYIEQVYPNLPETHSTLLTNHLRQMKNNGQLVMIKHSYALPGSVNFSFAGDFSPPATGSVDASFSGSKRKPGRPPKVQYQQQMSVPVSGGGFGGEPQGYSVGAPAPGYAPEFQSYSMSAPGYGADVQSYQMGAPGFGSEVQGYPEVGTGPGHDVQHYPGGGPEPMFVSLGLDDGPMAPDAPPPAEPEPESTPATVTKRGRGRPPKGSSPNGPVAGPTVASGGPTELGKRSRGRPAKPPRSITDIMSNGGLKPKTGRGRPRLTGPVIVPLAGTSPRPKSGATYSGKPRGRPRKVGGAGVMVPIEGGHVAARRPGRPARIGVARKLSGKSVGRPRKNSAVTAVIVTDPQQLVAYQELKGKYEHIQLKVKQAASLLRPCLNHEDAISALGALQELEALASGEVNNAPVNVQSQEPPQPLHDHQENLF